MCVVNELYLLMCQHLSLCVCVLVTAIMYIIGAELRETQKQIDHLPFPSDPNQVKHFYFRMY